MTKALYYPGADRTAQWAFGKYPGDVMNTNCVVLHTTETTSWPSYSTGYYPTLTYHPGQRRWRQHLPLNRSARALENRPGGVETNTANVCQVELVGTCDRSYKNRYGGVYWPEAPDSAMEDLAAWLAWMSVEWGVRLVAPPKWPAYPTSYANGGGQRLTGSQWRDFYGVCGHMHVPENAHGDPGNIDIARLLVMAERIKGGTAVAPAPKPAPTPTEDTMPTADEIADAVLKRDGVIRVTSGPDKTTNENTWSLATHVTNLRKQNNVIEDKVDALTRQVAELAAKLGGK